MTADPSYITRAEVEADQEVAHLMAGTNTETIVTVAAMQLRARSLFSEMIFGLIAGYRVEMDRSVHPVKFQITTWKKT